MARAISSARRVAALVLAFAPVALFAAPAPRIVAVGYAVPRTLPFGVADDDGKVGYFTGEKGGLEAVNLETGRVLWKAETDGQPLAVWDRKPVVLTRVKNKPGSVRVVVLDGDGVVSLTSTEIAAPGHRDGCQGWCRAAAYLDGDELLLDTSFAWHPAEEAKGRDSYNYASAVVRVNLKTGKAVTLDDEQKAALWPPLRLCDRMEEELKALPKDIQYASGAAWSNEPKRLFDGDRVGVVWRKQVGKEEALTLRTWDAGSGKDSQTTQLLRREYGCHLNHSEDGRYLFFQHEAKATPDKAHQYSWEVYRVATGKHVGTFLHNGYCIEAGVAGEQIFVVEEKPNPDAGRPPIRELFAVELKTGKTLWKRPAPEYRTAFPMAAP